MNTQLQCTYRTTHNMHMHMLAAEPTDADAKHVHDVSYCVYAAELMPMLIVVSSVTILSIYMIQVLPPSITQMR